MSEKLNPSPKIPNGEYPELSPNPNYTDGYIKGEHGTPVRVVTAPQRGIRQETEPTNFAELYVNGKAPLTELPEIPTGTKLYKHKITAGTTVPGPGFISSNAYLGFECINTSKETINTYDKLCQLFTYDSLATNVSIVIKRAKVQNTEVSSNDVLECSMVASKVVTDYYLSIYLNVNSSNSLTKLSENITSGASFGNNVTDTVTEL